MDASRPISASKCRWRDYSEHSLQHGSNAAAIAYVQLDYPGGTLFGAGINKNIVTASREAIVSAANRVLEERKSRNISGKVETGFRPEMW